MHRLQPINLSNSQGAPFSGPPPARPGLWAGPRHPRAPPLDATTQNIYLSKQLINQTVHQITSTDPLSSTFAALADPTRRAILQRLSAGEATVTQLAEPFPISLPAVSRHLKVLERAGLIHRTRDAQWRPCQLNAAPLRESAEWMAQYRKFWEASLDRLERYLDDTIPRETPDD